MPIPKTIIQTQRDEEVGRKLRQTWRNQNPDFEYRFFDDDAVEPFMSKSYPDLSETIRRLPLPVQKADLFRYAVIHKFGGVYSDVDTICLAPLDSYLDFDRNHLVAGIEMSPMRFRGNLELYAQHYLFPFQMLNWTFAASPEHPALWDVLEQIRYTVQGLSDSQLRTWSQNSNFTLQLTGPVRFTHALNAHLSRGNRPDISVLNQMTWGYCHGRNLDDDSPYDPAIKVGHLFKGSWWKPDHHGKTES